MRKQTLGILINFGAKMPHLHKALPVSGNFTKRYNRKMKYIALVLIVIFFACTSSEKKNNLPPIGKIETVDYRIIKDTLQEILQNNNGNFPVFVYDKQKFNKHLIFIGEQHGNDINDSRFDTIKKYYDLLNPNIALNEGGQIPDTTHYNSREIAITKSGALGLLKYLSDSTKIKLINADCPDSIETASLLRYYSKDLILFSFVTQRFILQYLTKNNNSTKQLEKEYEKFVETYLITRCKINLTVNEKGWKYYEGLYKKYNKNKAIDLKHFDGKETEKYYDENGILADFGRNSLAIRDSFLITNIYNNLQKHDKVFIVFGAAHLFSIKPTLDKIFKEN